MFPAQSEARGASPAEIPSAMGAQSTASGEGTVCLEFCFIGAADALREFILEALLGHTGVEHHRLNSPLIVLAPQCQHLLETGLSPKNVVGDNH